VAVSGSAAILDVDGTLVDSNYQHTLAWYRALRQHGHVVPVWRVHRHIGMGGDQLVAALCGDEVEEREGDDIRAAEKALFLALIDEVEPLAGARALIEDLKRVGRPVVLASSAKPDELERYLDLLDARGLADAWTSSGDVEATKPAPDIVESALERVGGGPAVMVGDSTWDCKAAARAHGGRADRWVLRAGAARRGRERRVRLDRGAAAALARNGARVSRAHARRNGGPAARRGADAGRARAVGRARPRAAAHRSPAGRAAAARARCAARGPDRAAGAAADRVAHDAHRSIAHA
jgi:beta-phosphoglucomutase-like phosphatase (HAD superfamily)